MANNVFEWSPQLDIGVNNMNHQHQILIDYMNKLFQDNEDKKPKTVIVQSAKKLQDYTIRHFKEEETYLASIDYPGLDTHKLVHKNLLQQLDGHIKDFQANGETLPSTFFDFLKFWLKAHIMGVDKKYGDFANKKAS